MSDPGYPDQYFQPGVTITFSSADVLPDRNPEADAVVIKAIIANKVVYVFSIMVSHHRHVDQGSSAEIMYWHCFSQLGADIQHRLQPFTTPLVDFASRSYFPEGIITLPVTVGDHPCDKLIYLDFIVVKASSPYNAILGRPAIWRLQAIVSTLHLAMKFPTPHGIATVRGDQQLARECYRIALRQADGEGTSTRPDPPRKVLSIQAPTLADPLTPLDDQTESLQIGPQADQLVLVGKLLPDAVKQQLLHLLREYVDVFAWSPKDLVVL